MRININCTIRFKRMFFYLDYIKFEVKENIRLRKEKKNTIVLMDFVLGLKVLVITQIHNNQLVHFKW